MKNLTLLAIALFSVAIQAQTGNVGIGTAMPANTLTVNGNASVGSNYSTITAPVNGALIEGDVGIGTSAPTEKLDISGKIKIVDGTQGENKILTSDANGVASWQPGAAVFTGSMNSPQNFVFVTPPGTTDYTADSPITLNKGTYILYYYVQFDYYQPGSTTTTRVLDPTNASTLYNTFPFFIYFNFVVSSGAATFPGAGNHPIPTITPFQVASRISQLAVVTQDNTVIRPHFGGFRAYGRISNIAQITAVKL